MVQLNERHPFGAAVDDGDLLGRARARRSSSPRRRSRCGSNSRSSPPARGSSRRTLLARWRVSKARYLHKVARWSRSRGWTASPTPACFKSSEARGALGRVRARRAAAAAAGPGGGCDGDVPGAAQVGGLDRGGRTAPAPRGGDAQVQLLQVADADGAGGEGGRADGEGARPRLSNPPLPQGRPARARGGGRDAARGARAVPGAAARDDRGAALRVGHVREGRRLLRAPRRPEARDGLLPQGAGVRPRRGALAPLLPGARRGRARAAVGRLPRRVQEPRRGDQPFHRGGGVHQGDRGGDLVPQWPRPADRRDARAQRRQAVPAADRRTTTRAQLRRGRAFFLRGGAPQEAVEMYSKINKWEKAHRVATQHDAGRGRHALHHASAASSRGQVQGGERST